jgi:large conductance mechanosensitive channel
VLAPTRWTASRCRNDPKALVTRATKIRHDSITSHPGGHMKFDIKGFRDFILRGNVVDLAIAVVIGVAFAAVVTAIVSGLITPLIGAIFGGKGPFETLSFTLNGSEFLYGRVLNAILSFIAIAAIIYFLVVIPVGKLMARYKPAPAEPQPVKECRECLSSIPLAASRCAFCTSAQ